MRFSKAFFPTLKEAPAEAEVVSHRLMMRAAMIRRLAAGVYTLLPLGVRTQRKVEQICREELARAGAQEVFLPTLNPAELWRKTGRWDVYGKELIRLQDRHGRDFCLGPTHEEVITSLIGHEVQSYRDLPQNLYQIQTKFRDEIRPRFGVMRGREFTMKDGYSFDRDEKGAEESYNKMVEAYKRIFKRCGLNFGVAAADSGSIGGSFSHEFMVMADTGEESISVCAKCGYSANTEKTPVKVPLPDNSGGSLEKVHTPGAHTVEEVSAFLELPVEQITKTLLYMDLSNETPVAFLIPGNRELNEVKAKNESGALHLQLADPATVERLTKATVGFAGPVGLEDVRVIADHCLKGRGGLVLGANETDNHFTGGEEGRDFKADAYADLTLAEAGDLCPECGESMDMRRGIEVGHVFKLGTKYSEALEANYLDESGETKTIVMGCYGIGIGRTVAAAIEQNHDDDGIVWPLPIAPFHVDIILANMKDAACLEVAEKLYNDLEFSGVEVVLDDRDERAGVKFKDADLIGFPYHVIVGPKGLKEGKLELKSRKTGEREMLPLDGAAEAIRDRIFQEIKDYTFA
ncbi:MAG: proline--tRNA ligase [Nitrospinaceae bacterium]|jgi:prolyl-tRNA synthetase|nr:proline--tRNA ligase [Nitrospinaceae bacterium]MBT3823088.1 proline--tRNA ligase [Nitrospinaceae bacterium]MBT4092334.1 proline--tRNA ligase [Nitrospinaceae bacterium]MBT4432281.1 proline--tRNA ligase [Nitrospinaceae bacterium]MBT5367972.1 proline--tRNA ligase [Nitrospinaceae bacterium]